MTKNFLIPFFISIFFLLSPYTVETSIPEEDIYKVVQITSYIGEDYSPAVSTDGKNLAFVSDRSGNLDIWIQSLEKGGGNVPIHVTRHSASDTSPAWSPDGSKIVFVSLRDDPKGDVYIVNLKEKDKSKRFLRLTNSDSFDSAPAWSPDGKHIAFASRKFGEISDNVCLINLKTGEKGIDTVNTLQNAFQKMQLTTEGGSSPIFSADGKYLAFATGSKGIWGNISVLRLSDNEIVSLTEGKEMDGFPAWSLDGKKIFFTRFSDDTNLDDSITIDDKPNIWSMEFNEQAFNRNAINLQLRQLTSSNTYDVHSYISPDNFLYYTSRQKGNIDIWRIAPTGLLAKQSSLEQNLKFANRICSDKELTFLCQLAYRNAIQDHSTSPDRRLLAEIQYKLAKTYQSLKNYSQAAQEYSVLQKDFQEIMLFRGISEIEMETIAVERATGNKELTNVSHRSINRLNAIIEKYKTLSPVTARAYLEMGNIFIGLKGNLKALQNYQRVIKQFPGEKEIAAEAAFNKSRLYLDFNSRDKLIQAFLSVLKEYPEQLSWGNKAADEIIGLFENEEEPLKKRINSLRQLVKKYEDIPILPARAQNKIGFLFYSDTENMRSKKEYNETVDRFPKEKNETASALFALAKIYFEEEEYEKSLKILREIEQSSVDSMDIFRKARKQFVKSSLEKGEREFNEGEVGLAIKTYRKLLDYDRSIIQAHRGLIRSYASLKKIDKIIEEYKKRAKESPDNPVEKYSLALALTYLATPPLDESIKLIQHSINLNSQVSYFHQTLGWLYEQKSMEDKKGVYAEQALEEYQAALALNDENEYPENEAALLLNYGNVSFHIQNYGIAYRYYGMSHRLRQKKDIPFENLKQELLYYQRFGQVAFKQGEYSKAADYFQKALKQAEQDNDLNRQAELNDRLALCYQEQGRYKKAYDYFSRVLSLNKKLNNVKNISITLRDMANNLYSLGELETGPEKTENLAKALKSYTESIDALEKYGAKEVKKQRKRGIFSFAFEKSIGTDASTAAKGFDKIGEEKLIFNYVGKIYKDFHDYDKAITYFKKKLNLTPSGLPVEGNVPVLTERAVILNQVGSLHYRKGNIIKSLDYFEKSLDLSMKLNNIHGITVNSTNIAKIEVEKYISGSDAITIEITQSDITLLNNALAHLEKEKTIKEPLQIISLKNYLAILHFYLAVDRNKTLTPVASTQPEAGSVLTKLSNVKPEKKDVLLKNSVLNGLAIISSEADNFIKSRDLLVSALALLEEHEPSFEGDSYYRTKVTLKHNLESLSQYAFINGEEREQVRNPKSEIRTSLDELAEERNLLDIQWKIKFINAFFADRESEIVSLKEAVDLLENIPFGFYANSSRQSIELKRNLYDRLVFLLMQNDKIDEALKYLERKKGMVLASQLSGKKLSFEDADRSQYFKNMLNDVSELKKIYIKLQKASPESPELNATKKDFNEKLQAHRDSLESLNEEDQELSSLFKPTSPDIKKIQDILNKNEIVLLYDINNNHLLSWSVTKQSFNGNSRPVNGELSRILNGGNIASEEHNNQLSALLLNDSIGSFKRIYIIADESLENIKWPLLKNNGKQLLDSIQTVHSVSLSHLLFSYDKRNLSRASFLSVNSDENFFNELKGNFKSSLNFYAEEKIHNAFINESKHFGGVIHIDKGVELASSEPANSFINLSASASDFIGLESWELFGLRREGNLVSISNIEERKKGKAVLSSLDFLAQSFSYAGYPSVLVENGRVEEAVRKKFLIKFYKYFAEKSISESLRLAQMEIQKENAGSSNHFPDYRLYGYGGMNDEEKSRFAESRYEKNKEAGEAFFKEGKWIEASIELEKALFLLEAVRKEQHHIIIYEYLSRANANMKKFKKAILYKKKMIKLLENKNDSELLAGALNSLGVLYSKVEDYSASVEHLSRAINFYKENEILDNLAESYTELGKITEQSSDYLEALKAFSTSTKIQDDVGETENQVDELRRIGRIYYKRLNQNKAAEDYFKKALFFLRAGLLDMPVLIKEAEDSSVRQLYEEDAIKLKHQEIQTLLDLGLVRERTGDFNAAMEYYEEAGSLAKDIDYKEAFTLISLYKANSYWFQADYQNAFNSIRKAIKIAEKQQNKEHLLQAYNTMGLIFWTLNDLEKAKINLNKSLGLAEEINSKLDIASAYNNLGLIYRKEKKYRESIEQFEKALAIDNKLKTKWGRGYDHRNIGMSYLRLGGLEKAVLNIEKAVNLSSEIGNRINEAKSMLEMGNIHLEKGEGEYKKAIHYFTNTHSMSKNINLPEVSWRALKGKGKSYWMLGDNEQALKNYKGAVEIVESMRASIKLEEFRNGFIENKQDLYKELILLLLETGEKEAAFNYSERARARSFIDLLGNHKLALKNDVGQHLFDKINEIKQQIHETKETPRDAEDEDFAKNNAKLSSLQNNLQNLLIELKEKDPQLSSFVTVDPIKIDEVYALLGPGVALVEFLMTKKEIIAWVVHKGEVNLARIPIEEKKINSLIKKYRMSMQELMPMDKISRELYDILIKPVEPFLDGVRHVGIIPNGTLHYLSFASLKNEEGYFIEQHPIFYSPSASVLKYTFARRSEEKNVKVLAVGNPDLGNLNYDLPLSEMEVNSIKWNFADIDVLTGGEATESWLINNIENYGIIHIASHGEFDDINPLFSALKLKRDITADGNLQVQEIFPLKIKADMVTLSACQTGLGHISGGDELIGLNRAFFYAGTHAIISSLWRIDDVSTAVLIKHFYRNYKSYNKAEALRKAQLLIKKFYPHPSYWSGLTLTGDYS